MDDEQTIDHVFGLIAASPRRFPAYFVGDRGREKTFIVDFDGLTEEDEYSMAGITHHLPGEFIKGESSMEHGFYTMLGEDAIVGSYIITKLGKPELAVELEKRLTQRTLKRLEGFDEVDVSECYARPGVREWLDFCVAEGIHMAQNGGYSSDRCFALTGDEGRCPHCKKEKEGRSLK